MKGILPDIFDYFPPNSKSVLFCVVKHFILISFRESTKVFIDWLSEVACSSWNLVRLCPAVGQLLTGSKDET